MEIRHNRTSDAASKSSVWSTGRDGWMKVWWVCGRGKKSRGKKVVSVGKNSGFVEEQQRTGVKAQRTGKKLELLIPPNGISYRSFH